MCSSRANDLRQLYLLARGLVRRGYAQRLTLVDVAAALDTSPRQLQRAYARFGRCGFREDLLGVRLATAAELLRECPEWSVAKVASSVGYRNAAHFSRAFASRYGSSPAGYRLGLRTAAAQASGSVARAACGCGPAAAGCGSPLVSIRLHPPA